jgi:hypothetical protein
MYRRASPWIVIVLLSFSMDAAGQQVPRADWPRQDIEIRFNSGNVTLVARDAPLKAVLEEWSRVGQTRILNIEDLSGEPTTLELANVAEEQALAVLLRDTGGFVVGPRRETRTPMSAFGMIVLVPSRITSPGPQPGVPQSPLEAAFRQWQEANARSASGGDRQDQSAEDEERAAIRRQLFGGSEAGPLAPLATVDDTITPGQDR